MTYEKKMAAQFAEQKAKEEARIEALTGPVRVYRIERLKQDIEDTERLLAQA